MDKANANIPQNNKSDTITIPIGEIFRQLKKYFLLWIIIAVVVACIIFGISIGTYESVESQNTDPIEALVSFTYDGIDEGLDPDGNEFDANTLRDVSIITDALTEIGFGTSSVDSIRSNLDIVGILDDDVIDELTAYESIFSSTNSVESAQAILDTTYFPTEYRITFTYSGIMSRADAIEFVNALLDSYSTWFTDEYGTNYQVGVNLTSIDYTSYDYPQMLDVLNSTLDTLDSFVDDMLEEDTATNFRSDVTGYSFDDLLTNIEIMQDVDYATLSAYVLQNNITQDKSTLISYYEYNIASLTRSYDSTNSTLESVIESIETYEKDAYIVYGDADTEVSEASDKYDNLIDQKISLQRTLSNTQSQIDDYTERLEQLEGNNIGTSSEMAEADEMVDALLVKLEQLIDDIESTADDYYDTALNDSFNILVPAADTDTVETTTDLISAGIDAGMSDVVAAELILVAIYLVFAIVRGFMVNYRQTHPKAVVEEAATVETEATPVITEASTDASDEATETPIDAAENSEETATTEETATKEDTTTEETDAEETDAEEID